MGTKCSMSISYRYLLRGKKITTLARLVWGRGDVSTILEFRNRMGELKTHARSMYFILHRTTQKSKGEVRSQQHEAIRGNLEKSAKPVFPPQ